MKRILLVEDHAALRQGLAYTLERDPEFEVVGQAGSVEQARAAIAVGMVDVAVIDLGLPDASGAELIRELKRTNPRAAVLVLTGRFDPASHEEAIEAGGQEVLTKDAGLREILAAIKRVAGG